MRGIFDGAFFVVERQATAGGGKKAIGSNKRASAFLSVCVRALVFNNVNTTAIWRQRAQAAAAAPAGRRVASSSHVKSRDQRA